MANNRMFLVYRPTGDAVYLGRRLGAGWSGVPEGLTETVMELFRRAQEAPADGISQDDFAIALEAGEHQPHVLHNWKYLDFNGGAIRKIVIDPSVPYGTPEEI